MCFACPCLTVGKESSIVAFKELGDDVLDGGEDLLLWFGGEDAVELEIFVLFLLFVEGDDVVAPLG